MFFALSLSLEEANLVPLNRRLFFCGEIECQARISPMLFDTTSRSIEFTKKKRNVGKTQVLEEL